MANRTRKGSVTVLCQKSYCGSARKQMVLRHPRLFGPSFGTLLRTTKFLGGHVRAFPSREADLTFAKQFKFVLSFQTSMTSSIRQTTMELLSSNFGITKYLDNTPSER
jgi:hypothetical protein